MQSTFAHALVPRQGKGQSYIPKANHSFPFSGISANFTGSSPFKGEARRGMGAFAVKFTPTPTLTLHLKGRESIVCLPLTGRESYFSRL
jgi:hypothetical protein